MSNVKRYALPIVLGALAIALAVVGVLSLTIWKPAQEVVASRDSELPFSMTRAGVFPLYADEVNVRATGESDQIIWLAVGDPEDVAAWLQEEPYEEVVGLVGNLYTLKAIDHNLEAYAESGAQSGEVPQSGQDVQDSEDAELAQDPDANPIYSDMWTHVKYGRGSVSVDLSGEEMDMSVLVATDGVGPAPTLTLTWKTPQSNLLALASFVAAAVVALIALVVALALWSTRKKRLSRSAHLREAESRASVDTAAIAVGSSIEDLPKRSSRRDKAKKALLAEGETLAGADTEEVSVESEDTGLDASVGVFSSDPTEPYADQESHDSKDVDEEADEASQAIFAPVPQKEDNLPAEDPEGEQPGPEETVAEDDQDEVVVAETAETVTEEDFAEETAEETVQETAEEATDDVANDDAARAAAAQEAARTETVTTDSGMMNLSALRGGGNFPTRKALRDARRRGVEQLVVGERAFDVPATPRTDSDPAQALRERSIGAAKWSEAMGEKD